MRPLDGGPCARIREVSHPKLINIRNTGLMLDEFSEITLLIADRATLFRHGLRGLLKVYRPGWACAEASSAGELQAHLRAESVDIVLFDLQLGGVAGLRDLRRDFPSQPIMVLADCDDRATILECLSAG